jgi:hypothetical protein
MRFIQFAAVAAAALWVAAAPAMAQMGPPQPLPAEVLADSPDAATVDWLKARVVIDGPVGGGLSFSLPADFYRNRLFLVAESHGSAAPQVLDLELLTHLNERIGLTAYLAEVDPVQGERLNAYLNSGDEVVLARVFDFWSEGGAQWGNTAFETKVRGIRALNLTLPAERRIRFVGVDAVQDWALLKDWIGEQGGVVDAAAWEGGGAQARAALALTALEGKAEQTVGLRLTDQLRRIAAGTDRETAIFETYAQAVQSGELGDRPAYGLWGLFHAMRGPVNGALPFAARVARSDLPTADRVTTLSLLSLDSAVQIPVPLPTGVQRMRLSEFNIDGPFVKVQGSATLRAATTADRITVFDLAGDDSPVRTGDFLTIRTSIGQNFALEPGRPTMDYSRYVGVYRGSDWAAPRE